MSPRVIARRGKRLHEFGRIIFTRFDVNMIFIFHMLGEICWLNSLQPDTFKNYPPILFSYILFDVFRGTPLSFKIICLFNITIDAMYLIRTHVAVLSSSLVVVDSVATAARRVVRS